MRVHALDHISELLAGIGGATYEIRIPFERALDPAELHQIRLDIDRAYLPANARVERIWQQPQALSAKPFVRKWNLNEAKGRCAGTNIVEAVMKLHLGLSAKMAVKNRLDGIVLTSTPWRTQCSWAAGWSKEIAFSTSRFTVSRTAAIRSAYGKITRRLSLPSRSPNTRWALASR